MDRFAFPSKSPEILITAGSFAIGGVFVAIPAELVEVLSIPPSDVVMRLSIFAAPAWSS
ncbi:MAG: hypothetical protein NZ553_05610 [Caldilinea sp.]|nr:hypothetical protein [Caldilinea sp.]MDW8439935.1 hypothetical protein [Caldilineaceae bacterium]